MVVLASPSFISGHASDTAAYVAEQIDAPYMLLQKSNALGLIAKGTFQQLEEVYKEFSTAGWDGEQAVPISKGALRYAQIFLQSFPFGIEPPEIGAEPDGSITLEWYRSSNRVMSISINHDGWVYYAAIIGTSRRHGVDFSMIGISDDLIDLISEITKGS